VIPLSGGKAGEGRENPKYHPRGLKKKSQKLRRQNRKEFEAYRDAKGERREELAEGKQKVHDFKTSLDNCLVGRENDFWRRQECRETLQGRMYAKVNGSRHWEAP